MKKSIQKISKICPPLADEAREAFHKVSVGNLDEIGKVATDFNNLIEIVRDMLHSTKLTSGENAVATDHLHSMAKRLKKQSKGV